MGFPEYFIAGGQQNIWQSQYFVLALAISVSRFNKQKNYLKNHLQKKPKLKSPKRKTNNPPIHPSNRSRLSFGESGGNTNSKAYLPDTKPWDSRSSELQLGLEKMVPSNV